MPRKRSRAELDRARQYMAERRARLRAAGLCVVCGRRPPHEQSSSRCAACVLRDRKSSRKRAGSDCHAPGKRGRPPIPNLED